MSDIVDEEFEEFENFDGSRSRAVVGLSFIKKVESSSTIRKGKKSSEESSEDEVEEEKGDFEKVLELAAVATSGDGDSEKVT